VVSAGSHLELVPQPAEREHRCTLCSAPALRPLYEVRDKQGKPVALYECGQCGAIVPGYERPATAAEALTTQVGLHEQEWHAQGQVEVQHLVEDCASIADAFAAYLGSPSPDRWVCELGAGRGGVLGALKARGHAVVGCEPSTELSAIARRFAGLEPQELYQETADELLGRIEREHWPVRTWILWHVLEHLPEPWEMLKRVAALSRPGDYVLGQGPLVGPDNVFPEHYFFLTEAAVTGLAESSGFSLVRLDYDHARAFMSFVLRRTTARPSARWVAARSSGRIERARQAGQGGAPRGFGETADEIDPAVLEQQVDELRGALEGRDRQLEERAAEIEALESELRRREDGLRHSQEARAAIEREVLELAERARPTWRKLASGARGAGRTSTLLPKADSPLALLSLHATDRLYRRWRELRSLDLSDTTPAVGERLLVAAARALPLALSGLEAAEIEAAVARLSRTMKRLAAPLVPVAAGLRSLLRRAR